MKTFIVHYFNLKHRKIQIEKILIKHENFNAGVFFLFAKFSSFIIRIKCSSCTLIRVSMAKGSHLIKFPDP